MAATQAAGRESRKSARVAGPSDGSGGRWSLVCRTGEHSGAEVGVGQQRVGWRQQVEVADERPQHDLVGAQRRRQPVAQHRPR